MKEMLLDVKTVGDENISLCCRYFVLVGEMQAGVFSCESYGVKIENAETGESASFPDLTLSAEKIDKLMECLIRNRVTPAGLEDVIRDWQ